MHTFKDLYSEYIIISINNKVMELSKSKIYDKKIYSKGIRLRNT